MPHLLKFMTALLLISAITSPLSAKTLPLPPRPNAPGEKQPVFGADDGQFTFDGEPAVIISGSIHYPRVPRAYWRDRIQKAKAMGFNCIGTYVFWNAHEKMPGEFDFTGNLDVAEFVRICQEEGMWVIVRPSPYVCAEWDFGGIPAWLLKETDLQVRTNDPRFLAATARYLKAVGGQLKDLQVTHGGPIIQIQVENEFGQFGIPGNKDDMAYNRTIYEQMKAAGFDTMFIRCDWPVKSTIGTAHIDDVYTTMNFGGSAKEAFGFFEKEYPGKPKMCGEYWVGWFDHWGAKHHTKALAPFIEQIEWMLDNAISFNVYMLHGGSNFGFTSGANWSSSRYSADTTSYDYDSPIDETGRITEKFYTFRDTLKKYLPSDYELPEPPAQIRRIDIPEFMLTQTASFGGLIRKPSKLFKTPPHMEALDQTQGLALYRSTLNVPEKGKYQLSFSALKDRAIVIVNGKRVATLDRRYKQDSARIDLPAGKVTLDILLENMGHLNYSRELMKDRKGLGEVALDGKPVEGWQVYSFPLENSDIAGLDFSDAPAEKSPMPVFYRGEFTVDEIGDTLLDMTGWGKGMVWVNGINLGRYWRIGPQYTLYLPGCWLKDGKNEVVVMDIESTGHHALRGVTDFIYGLELDAGLGYSRKPGEIIELSDDQVIAEGRFDDGEKAQEVRFSKAIKARYICIESLSSHSNDNNAAIAEIHLIDPSGRRLDRDDWEVIYADSEELVAEPTAAGNILDEQPVTFWHTQYQGEGANRAHPHQVVIDLGKEVSFRTLRYLPREGNNPGKIRDYRVYASDTLFKGLKAR
ncbi:MAG: beta-galactosidase [Pontiellaceae bacterium]|nr:beta-galactosidase [Pontiellaceae bacterium]MBN2783347.1 beta-galactosidase [Pontiellaceae bacterium]